VSKLGKAFLANIEISWWKTPPESPDLNPIENLWHKLKEYIRREVKPKTKDELVEGIKEFWSLVSGEKCQKYIQRLCPGLLKWEGQLLGTSVHTIT